MYRGYIMAIIILYLRSQLVCHFLGLCLPGPRPDLQPEGLAVLGYLCDSTNFGAIRQFPRVYRFDSLQPVDFIGQIPSFNSLSRS